MIPVCSLTFYYFSLAHMKLIKGKSMATFPSPDASSVGEW